MFLFAAAQESQLGGCREPAELRAHQEEQLEPGALHQVRARARNSVSFNLCHFTNVFGCWHVLKSVLLL
jgi:hypothetical protein